MVFLAKGWNRFAYFASKELCYPGKQFRDTIKWLLFRNIKPDKL